MVYFAVLPDFCQKIKTLLNLPCPSKVMTRYILENSPPSLSVEIISPPLIVENVVRVKITKITKRGFYHYNSLIRKRTPYGT